MNVNLTPKLEEMVREKVKMGLYNNASEVIREALRLLEQKDRFTNKIWSIEEIERELDKTDLNSFSEGINSSEIKLNARNKLKALLEKNVA